MRSRVLVAVAVLAGALGAGLLVAGLVGRGDGGSEPAPTGPIRDPAIRLAGIPQDGTALGRPDARRTLGVYADVQCPFCARWEEEELPAIVEEYVRPGKLRIELRGLAFIGDDSELGLRAVLAAGLQDRAWSLLGILYANQGKENSGWLSEASLRRLGAAVPGLDVDKMLEDRDAPQVDRELDAAEQAASGSGVLGTPSFELGPTGGQLLPVTADELSEQLAG